jgi:DNA helicase HerA-like ATPase
MTTGVPAILIAKGEGEIFFFPKMANRHGLIAGATGTGKTVSLRVLAEQFSAIGVPVFLADVKGDLATISQPGGGNPKINERILDLGLKDFSFQGYPVTFWDVFGEKGHPLRATVSASSTPYSRLPTTTVSYSSTSRT